MGCRSSKKHRTNRKNQSASRLLGEHALDEIAAAAPGPRACFAEGPWVDAVEAWPMRLAHLSIGAPEKRRGRADQSAAPEPCCPRATPPEASEPCPRSPPMKTARFTPQQAAEAFLDGHFSNEIRRAHFGTRRIQPHPTSPEGQVHPTASSKSFSAVLCKEIPAAPQSKSTPALSPCPFWNAPRLQPHPNNPEGQVHPTASSSRSGAADGNSNFPAQRTKVRPQPHSGTRPSLSRSRRTSLPRPDFRSGQTGSRTAPAPSPTAFPLHPPNVEKLSSPRPSIQSNDR